MEQTKKVVIIGAGISGLSAGISSRLNGFETEIYEKLDTPGGLCTCWYRDGMVIDGCVHWLTGTAPGHGLHTLWQSFHAFKDEDVVQAAGFGRYEYQGQTITMWADLDKLEKEWCALSPVDAKQIKKLCKTIIKVGKIPLPYAKPTHLMNIFEYMLSGLKLLPYAGLSAHLSRITVEQFTARFQHPGIRWALNHCLSGGGNAMTLVFVLASVACRNAGLVKGGSIQIINNMKEYYESLGGKLFLNAEVGQILIEKKHATGIALVDGKKVDADFVIAAPDVNITLTKLLRNEYEIKAHTERIRNRADYRSISACQFTFAIDHDLSDISKYPVSMYWEVPPFQVATKTEDHISFRSYGYDPKTFTRNGKTTTMVLVQQHAEDYFFWKNLQKKSRKEYEEYKNNIGLTILKMLEKEYPEFQGKIKLIDLVTPLTYHRYTGAQHGAYMPFLFDSRSKRFSHSGVIRHIKNLFLAGQWLFTPGGLPMALCTGFYAIRRVCKTLHRKFILTLRGA
jgi:phytoene dehydrogenase-like protein